MLIAIPSRLAMPAAHEFYYQLLPEFVLFGIRLIVTGIKNKEQKTVAQHIVFYSLIIRVIKKLHQ